MKLNSISSLLFLPMFPFVLSSQSHAQGNLVNLYTWSNATLNVPNPLAYLPIISSSSCEFIGGFTYVNGYPFPVSVNPVLTADIATSPGTTYQISFTMEQMTPIAYSTSGTMSFGNIVANLSSAISSSFYYTNNGYGEEVYPTNFDFTAVATSTSTTASFSIVPDSSGLVALYNFNIEAVPEPSAGWLLALGGMAIFSTKTGRRLVPCVSTAISRTGKLRACLKIARGAAARDFGRGQGGEGPSRTGHRASPQRAVRAEPTQVTDTRPAARRVFAPKAVWLRCSSVEDPPGIFSFVAPRQPAFCAKTAPLGIFRQALRFDGTQFCSDHFQPS